MVGGTILALMVPIAALLGGFAPGVGAPTVLVGVLFVLVAGVMIASVCGSSNTSNGSIFASQISGISRILTMFRVMSFCITARTSGEISMSISDPLIAV